MQRGKVLGRGKGRIKAVSETSLQYKSVDAQLSFFQKSSNDSVLLAEFGTRRKRVKDTCEKYGAYTTRWGSQQ